MNIVLDGMGGDYAPHEMVKGAVQAAELIEDDIYIVGKEDMIQAELNKMGYQGEQIHIVNAQEVITMEDSPVKAIRRKSDSSMVVGLNMIKEGTGDVFVSGGNTGALVVGSRLILGRIEGDRSSGAGKRCTRATGKGTVHSGRCRSKLGSQGS